MRGRNALSPGFRNNFGHYCSESMFGDATVDANYLFLSTFLLEPIVRYPDRHLPKFGVHRSRLRCYDERWMTLPDLSFIIRNRRRTVPGPTPSALLALPLTCFCGEPTNMSDVFAAAWEVMRSLRTASRASATRSGPTLGLICLAADRPKTDFRERYTRAYWQCCRMP